MSLRQRTAGGAPSLRRGILAASLALAAAGALSACAASNDAATLDIKPDLSDTTVGSIKIQNAVVIVPEGDPGAPAAVSAAVINLGKRAQTLQSVTVQGSPTPFDLARPGGGRGPVTVPANGSLLLGGRGHASASLPNGAGTDVVAALGGYRTVTFRLSTTGEVKIRAIVVPSSGYYKPFGPTPQATPVTASPSASSSGSPSGKPSSSTTPSASGSAKPGSTTATATASAKAKTSARTSARPSPGASSATAG